MATGLGETPVIGLYLSNVASQGHPAHIRTANRESTTTPQPERQRNKTPDLSAYIYPSPTSKELSLARPARAGRFC
ncbi:hypothetical protein PpBr36_02977 [Pyricularia pennisetigena]|uniref:hypothetical protein n=1 Tax=Pyricularia pennisetigena TaxID=1578925 RepID=UPI00114E6156|nr:hypothetical protein PpBr36_02977 [Pyricularia pennisetigena]TLS31149.1 hypothetical protein PpBr36_02977 [Pyricularia pennisetigena]